MARVALAGGAIALCLGVGAYVVVRKQLDDKRLGHRPALYAEATESQDDREQRKRSAPIAHELSRSRRSIEEVGTGVPTPVSALTESEHGASPEPERVVTEEERRVYAGSVFDNESRDGAWARNAETALTTALPELLGAHGSMRGLECRATLCRVEFQHDDLRSQQEFLRALARSDKWVGGGMAIADTPEGVAPPRLTVYLAKSGVDLPEPPL